MDNKLWEGHRMILPELRERILDNNKPTLSMPRLSEEELARIEEKIKFAAHFKKPLLITYCNENKVEECLAFSFRLLPGLLECSFEKGIKRQIDFDTIISAQIL